MARFSTDLTPPTYENKVAALFDFWKFVDLINFHGGAKAFGDCHRELMTWSDGHGQDRELALMPRGHLKSTLMTVARTLHRVYQNPNIRIFVGTATRPLATAFVREIRTYLEDEYLCATVWNDRPHIPGLLIPPRDRVRRNRDTESVDRKIVWSTSAVQVIRPDILKEPTVTVGSVGSIPTGFHYDELKLDDVVTYDNINTPDKLDRLYAWINDLICVLDPKYFDEDLFDVLSDVTSSEDELGKARILAHVGGKITVVGTRYDRHDWYSDIIENQSELGYAVYQRNIYKNGRDPSDGYLWHELWTPTIESERRAQMTQTRFASQYLNIIIAPGSNILSMDKMNFIDPGRMRREGDVVIIEHSSLGDPVRVRPILVVDPAATVGENSDYTAMCVGGKDARGRVYIIDYKLGKWIGEDILRNLYFLADKWGLRGAWIESVGGFAHFVEYVRASFHRYRPLVLMEYKPNSSQGKKEVRIANALEPIIENGMFYITRFVKTDNEACDQIVFFPRDTVHDDFPDCMAALAELAKSPSKNAVSTLAKYKNKIYGGYR